MLGDGRIHISNILGQLLPRAHGRDDSHLVRLPEDHVFDIISQHVYIVEVDCHEARVEDPFPDPRVPRLQLGKQLLQGDRRGEGLVVLSGEGAGAGKVEHVEVAGGWCRGGHLGDLGILFDKLAVCSNDGFKEQK